MVIYLYLCPCYYRYHVSFSHDSMRLATCSHDGILRIHNSLTGAVLCTSVDLEDGVFVGTFVSETVFATAWQQVCTGNLIPILYNLEL